MPATCPATELSEADIIRFRTLTDRTLAPWQVEQVGTPSVVYPDQREVLATHWHPEFVPLPLVMQRLNAMFPNREQSLIIPTQHNILTELDGLAGVEVDCFDPSFREKVQLLVHFEASRLKGAGTFRAMLARTFSYRATQLMSVIRALEKPAPDMVFQAMRHSGADREIVRVVAACAAKLRRLIEEAGSSLSPDVLKNKLVRDYLDDVRPFPDAANMATAHGYLRAVKDSVKDGFAYSRLYPVAEIIEEVRGLGGCIVIPHPEQFWPVLLADYDVDGIEVWNPQSQRYTEFLIGTVDRRNAGAGLSRRRTLLFMGDDCHLSEKTRPRGVQDPVKAAREVGLQPAWDDPSIRAHLIRAGASRASVIAEYRARLAG